MKPFIPEVIDCRIRAASLFNMVKPGSIGWLYKLVNVGLGIMIDDIVAEMMADIYLWRYVAFSLYERASHKF